jgi:tRNA modification GTPase
MVQTAPPADPVHARLTAPGRGAIATILVSDANLPARLGPLFRPASGKDLSDCLSSGIIYGRWVDQAAPGEDLIICPLTSTLAEIHCHGGDAAVNAIIRSLERSGFRAATDQEFNDIFAISPWKSDAEQALQEATTERTSLILLELYQTIDQKIEALVQLIQHEPPIAARVLREILELSEFGIHLTRPWSVVLCGQPNVGKSSLINAMVGFERAIVHETAGTTRDVVEQLTAIDGWPVQLKDTAGLRLASDHIEEQGVHKARQQIDKADLLLLVVDATENERPDARSLGLDPDRCLVVVNKSDLVANRDSNQVEIRTSAKTGQGIDRLVAEIADRLVPKSNLELMFPVNALQVAMFERVLQAVESKKLSQATELLQRKA